MHTDPFDCITLHHARVLLPSYDLCIVLYVYAYAYARICAAHSSATEELYIIPTCRFKVFVF